MSFAHCYCTTGVETNWNQQQEKQIVDLRILSQKGTPWGRWHQGQLALWLSTSIWKTQSDCCRHAFKRLSSFNYSRSYVCLLGFFFFFFLFFFILIFFNHSLSPFYQSIVCAPPPCGFLSFIRSEAHFRRRCWFRTTIFSPRGFCRIKALVQNQFPLLSIMCFSPPPPYSLTSFLPINSLFTSL